MNAVIYRKGSNEISHFVKDCVRKGNLFIGSNKKVGVSPRSFDVVWTEDEVSSVVTNTILSEDGILLVPEQVSWDKTKKVSDITPATSPPVEKGTVTQREYSEAFKIRQLLDRMTYQDVEEYIESNVTDLPSAKIFLKRLSKVVLALARIVDKEH